MSAEARVVVLRPVRCILRRLIVEAASKHDPGLQSLIDEAIVVLGSNPLSDSRLILFNPKKGAEGLNAAQPDRLPDF